MCRVRHPPFLSTPAAFSIPSRLLSPFTPSEGVGHTRVFLTPLEGAELSQCLHVRCAPVFHFRQNLSGTYEV